MDRTGLLCAVIELADRVPGLLPPEHRIVAERRNEATGFVDFMIAGPFMPAAAFNADPPEVELVMTMHRDDPASPSLRLTAAFYLRTFQSSPVPQSLGDWEIGRWASLEAYRQAMVAL